MHSQRFDRAHHKLLRILWTVIVVALLGAAHLTAYAAVLMTQQGRLTDVSGAPLPDGPYEVTFKLYESMLAPTPSWTETQTVSLKDGLFNAILGTITPLGEDLLTPPAGGSYLNGIERYLSVTVTGYPELPRVRLTGVPYAAVATRVTGDVTTRPGEIVLRAPGVVSKAAGTSYYTRLSPPGMDLFGDPSSTDPVAGLETDPIDGPQLFLDADPSAPGHSTWLTRDGLQLDRNQDGISDVEINTQSNAFNVANPIVTTLRGPTNLDNSCNIDSDNDGTPELLIAGGETIVNNGVYCYIDNNPTPSLSLDNLGGFRSDPDGNASSAGLSYTSNPMLLNVRGSAFTMDRNNNGINDFNISTSGFLAMDCDFNGSDDVLLGASGCNFKKPLSVSGDGDNNYELIMDFSGNSAFNPDEDAFNELAVGDNAVNLNADLRCNTDADTDFELELSDADFTVRVNYFQCNTDADVDYELVVSSDLVDINASLQCNPNGDIVNELEVAADAVSIDGDLWLVGDASIDPDDDGDQDWYTFTIGPNDNGFAFNPDGADTPLLTVVGDHVDVAGNFNCTGTKLFVQQHPTEPDKEIAYVSLEGGEAGTYTRGASKLENGVATVELPEHFGLVTNAEGLTAQITPRGPVQSMLYVESVTPTHLIVKASNPADKDVRFDYLVNGVRSGFEDHQVIRDKQSFTTTR